MKQTAYTILFLSASVLASAQDTHTNGATISNDKPLSFLNNSGVNDGTSIERFTGNALRFRYKANSLIFDALDDKKIQIRNANDEEKIALHPNGNSYFLSGNIGIGTTSPSVALAIDGTGEQWTYINGSTNSGIRLGSSTGGRLAVLYRLKSTDLVTLRAGTDDGELAFITGGSTNERVRIDEDGHVGIGTTSPDAPLNVENANDQVALFESTDAVTRVTARNSIASSFVQMRLGTDNGDDHGYLVVYGSSHSSQANETSLKNKYGNLTFFTGTAGTTSERMVIDSDGDVGIGTSSPDEKLTVKGKIHSEEVIVDLSVPGPDYVFADDYDLPSLEAIESFIKSNKHLPEIPSAKEMEENGVELGVMNMLLLKKIEELTLHVITLNQENKELNNKLQASSSKNVDLNEQLEAHDLQLKAILSRIEKLETIKK